MNTILVLGQQRNLSEQDLIHLLKYQKFIGTWKSEITSMDQFHYLDYQEGQAEVIFNNYLEICFLNPKYHENKQVYLSFSLSNYNNYTQSWSGEQNFYLQFKTFAKFQGSYFSCKGNFLVKILFDKSFADIKNTKVYIFLQSDDCYLNISLLAESRQEEEYRSTLTFMIISIILSLIQIIASILQIRVNLPDRYDISFLANLINYDSNITLSSINQELFINYLESLGKKCKIFISALLLKFLSIYKLFINNLQIWLQFIGLLSYFSLFFLYEFHSYSMFSSAFILYPIIIRNIRLNIIEKFNIIYIFGFFSAKTFYFFYCRGYSENQMSFEPKYLMVVLYLIIYLTSIALLLIQKKFGSRSLICMNLRMVNPIEQLDDQNIPQDDELKQEDNNFFKIDNIVVEDFEACSICLNPLNSNRTLNDSLYQSFIEGPLIQTPCNHIFHLKCFKQYIQSRINSLQNNCPICRQQLPQFQ
ncbi:unnamed protein product [Paramecium sonneborni]|uniref:RING-type domain-containing protein n=1 Tax=Paramecium sonneborni TaxID=65129 RepID=A0A8S1Q8P5_9CILI|nr:unnamed protein product [Paramecium sonneborni]